jgi:hypothetical protein
VAAQVTPSTVTVNPTGALVTVMLTVPPLCWEPSVEKFDGDFWLLYSVPIHPADRAVLETRISSRFPT